MSEDLYAAPSFQFYPTDFLGDTHDLSAMEIGVYIRLLCIAWKEGGIPSDVKSLARSVHLSAEEMQQVWDDVISRYWKAHPSVEGRLINGRMEEVRADALAAHQRRVEASKAANEAKAAKKTVPEPKGDRNESPSEPTQPPIGTEPEPNGNRTGTDWDDYRTPDSVLRSPNTDSLRSSALAFGEWPTENDGLRKLAKFFMAAFGNIRTADAAKKHYPAYLEALSIFRSRSVPLVVAWQACTDCLEANNGVPLFGAKIKKAVSFLPARANVTPLRPAGSVSQYRTFTDAELEAMP